MELFDADIFLAQDITWQTRQIYNMFDLLGDLGGVTQVITIVFGIIFYPMSEHNFIIDATSRLFMARTKDAYLFEDCSEKKEKRTLYKHMQKNQEEIGKHRHIKIRFKDSMKLYITNQFCSSKLGQMYCYFREWP